MPVVLKNVDVKIISNDTSRLSEIGQTKTVKFAFLIKDEEKEGTFKTFHPLIKCRDYFSDTLHYKAINKPFSIYGFNLTPETNLLDLEITRMLVKLPAGASDVFVNNFPMIREFEEKYLGFSEAHLFSVKGKREQFVLETSPFWQKSTQLISLLTLLCRASLYLKSPTEDWMAINESGVDGRYIASLRKFNAEKQWPLLMKLSYDKAPTPSGWKINQDVDTIHNESGILTFCCRGEQLKESDNYVYLNAKNNFFIKEMTQLLGLAA